MKISAEDYFEDASQLKTDPEMVDLAMQLIQRKSGKYDPADLKESGGWMALVERGWEISEEVAELKAHTPERLQAKARMVLIELGAEADPTKPCCNHQYFAPVSLARLGRA